MQFEEEPDYEFLKGLFVKVLKDQKEEVDYMYDWSTSKPTKTIEEIKAEKIEGDDIINIDINNMTLISLSNDNQFNQLQQKDQNSNTSVDHKKREDKYELIHIILMP